MTSAHGKPPADIDIDNTADAASDAGAPLTSAWRLSSGGSTKITGGPSTRARVERPHKRPGTGDGGEKEIQTENS